MMHILRTAVPIILLAALVFTPRPATGSQVGMRLQVALATAAPNATIPVIIRLSEQLDPAIFKHLPKKERRRQLVRELRSNSDRSQKDLRKLLHQAGIRKMKDLWHINALALDADPALIAILVNRPEVASVSLDRLVDLPNVQPLAAVATPEWNLTAIGVFDLWSLLPGLPGDGMVVATIDTGVSDHPALQNWRGGPFDWFDPADPDNVADSPFDTDGHGTAVMGIISGSAVSGDAIGVAPAAQWIAANPFATATTSFSSLHSSFAWAMNPDGDPETDDAPDVVNNSWALYATNICSLEFLADINLLKSVGIAVVFAAGNSGPDSLTSYSPGNNPGVLAVGATDQQDVIAPFSSRGTSACDGGIFPEVVAPGVDVLSTALGGTYKPVTGTSFSTPHIAGVMALLMQAFPDATVSELESALKYATDDLGPTGSDQAYGYGLVNAVRSYRYLDGEPILRSPSEQAVGVALPVVFNWAQRYALPTSLLISDSIDFSQTVPIVITKVTAADNSNVLLAGCGLFAVGLVLRCRFQQFLRVLLLLVVSFLLLSCGGSGSTPVGEAAGVVMSYTVSDLNPATTYYWQVQTTDTLGGVRSSVVHSFTTQ